MRYVRSAEPGCRRYARRARRGEGDDPLRPTLEHVLDLAIEAEARIGETGDGLRRIVPIVVGTGSGRIEGQMLPGGADYQLFRVDRPTELVAKYAFETDDGDRVYVEDRGIRHASPEHKEGLRDGESVPPGEIYTRSTTRF